MKAVKESKGAKILRWNIGLLVNMIILLCLYQCFQVSYDFAYQIFGANSKSRDASMQTTIVVEKNDSLLEVANKLELLRMIDNKYAFYIRGKFSGYDNKIKPGKYTVNQAMNNEEILSKLAREEKENEDE